MSKRVESKPGQAWTAGNSWDRHKVRDGRMQRRVAKRVVQLEAGAERDVTLPSAQKADRTAAR